MRVYDLKGNEWISPLTLKQFEQRVEDYDTGNRGTSFEVTREAKGVYSSRTLFVAEVAVTLTMQKNKQAS